MGRARNRRAALICIETEAAMLAPSFHLVALVLLAQATPTQYRQPILRPPAEVKQLFLKQLDRPKVPLDVKAETPGPAVEGLATERLSFATEKMADGRIERVPTIVIRPEGTGRRRPAVIVLHGTGGTKIRMKPWLLDLAKLGFVAVAIDARYHGDRANGASGSAEYNKAITRAWKASAGEPQEHPFYYDTCWDLWRTVDYLRDRPDVDPDRIGMIGVSMGGIETWLAAAVDERVAVAVPAIAVQSFHWSLQNGQWQGRARTIAAAHEAAAADLGEPAVNERVCQALWDKVVPGIRGPFDCPSMIRLFAGRPLLILNGGRDPNCPIGGAEIAFKAARSAFVEADASDKLNIIVAKDVGHAVTDDQRKAALDWFVRWLNPSK